MCGICGIVDFSGAVPNEQVLSRMTSSLAHRWPDGEGIVYAPFFGFGHRRLAINEAFFADVIDSFAR